MAEEVHHDAEFHKAARVRGRQSEPLIVSHCPKR